MKKLTLVVCFVLSAGCAGLNNSTGTVYLDPTECSDASVLKIKQEIADEHPGYKLLELNTVYSGVGMRCLYMAYLQYEDTCFLTHGGKTIRGVFVNCAELKTKTQKMP